MKLIANEMIAGHSIDPSGYNWTAIIMHAMNQAILRRRVFETTEMFSNRELSDCIDEQEISWWKPTSPVSPSWCVGCIRVGTVGMRKKSDRSLTRNVCAGLIFVIAGRHLQHS